MIAFANGALIARPIVACEFLGLNVVHSQCLRWRKPLWLGTAKTKVFRVPVKPSCPKEEMAEILRLHNNYRTYRESLRRYFMEQAVQGMVQYDEETLRQTEEEDYARCSSLNAEWNKEVAKSRERREFLALEARREEVLLNIMNKEKRDSEQLKLIEETVRKAKAEAPSFITAKNIDEAIDEALGKIVNYNFAIDLEGTRYEGKYVAVAKEPGEGGRLQAGQ